MDRRAALRNFLGQRPAGPVVLSGLQPYDGPWEFRQAAHLLRRTTFGPGTTMIQEAVDQGLETTLDALLAERDLPDPPLNYNFNADPHVPLGATWVHAPYPTGELRQQVNGYRNRSLRAWTVLNMLEEGMSVVEKMTLFWHNHFAINNINDAKYNFQYIATLRRNALGNFRTLVKLITIDPAMLRFLNGNQNSSQSPNENYARELLELFTIGKGPQAGPGDYTHYTEEDVREIARALTGWIDRGYFSINPDQPVTAQFLPPRHDGTRKQLSHRFNNAVIVNGGENEYAQVIDIIFGQREVARYIARKLYRWFVYYEIDEQVEQEVIEPLADLLIGHDYEVRPALRALLSSRHFFDQLNVGPMIKNPLDFTIGIFGQTGMELPVNILQRYTIASNIFRYTAQQQMEYFNIPEVAGWKAYYQEPVYYRMWINASTLPYRMDLTDLLTTTGFAVPGNPQERIRIDVLGMTAATSDPKDPNILIGELAALFLPQPLTESQADGLKDILIPGLPDYEWTIEYEKYLNNPNDQTIRTAVESKLRALFQRLLSLPEFYLS